MGCRRGDQRGPVRVAGGVRAARQLGPQPAALHADHQTLQAAPHHGAGRRRLETAESGDQLLLQLLLLLPQESRLQPALREGPQ